MNKISWSKYLPLITKNFNHKYDEETDILYLHFDNPNPISNTITYIGDHVIVQLDKKEMPVNITIYQLHETIKDPQAQELLKKVPPFVIKTAERILGIKL
ncbi:MAG: DUF2283 domain-containing protein [Thermotogae bacterium]|jgi:uncharacterized protein YuzE|nr:DUF2283 domain-containing protein [Thermotogota bacterium]